MIFFPLSFVSFGVAFGAIFLLVLNYENAEFLSFIDGRPLKTFALWLLCINAVGLIALFTLSLIVPRPKVIWYNLIYVWVASLVGTLASNAFFGYLSDGKTSIQVGKPEDILGVVAIFVAASIFSAWRVELLAKAEK